MRSRLFSKLCRVSLAIVFSGALFAIPLAPGGVGVAAAGALPAGGVLTGPIAYACPTADCTTTGGNAGTTYVGVYQEAGGTGTDFLYQVDLTAGADYRIMTLRGFSCASCLPTVDVFFLASGSEPAGFATPAVLPTPVTVDRSVDGDRIHFNWAVPPGFGPGVSNVMVVHTAAQGAQSGVPDQFGGVDTGSFSSKAFAPIPEPSFVGLFLGGLFGAGLIVARRYRIRQS